MNAGGAAGQDMHGTAGGQSTQSLLGFEQHPNPFADPGDDRIFTFKDEERTRKERERQ